MSGKYRTIVADPPWPMPKGGANSNADGAPGARWGKNQRLAERTPGSLPYAAMTITEICELPVKSIADRDCHLYLWVPNRHLELSFGVARDWGFRPSVVLTWCKEPRGIGLGGLFTQTTEFVLFARRGTLRATKRLDTTWWRWTRPHNNHSAKPEAFLDIVEQISPGPYLEMFARRQRLGWDTWGNEALNHVELTT